MDFQYILIETHDRAGLIRFNRPAQLNALNSAMMEEIASAGEQFDQDANIGAIVIAGNKRAFAVGADIKEMTEASAVEMLLTDWISKWDRLRNVKKPLIAAVSGFCLGGGCELALACDLIIAAESAKFGQPEINLGVIPGAGGTQRLTRAVGKAIAMEMVLNGRFLSAAEADQFGLVNRVVPSEQCLDEALNLANEIAARAPLAIRLGKEAVNNAFETFLNDGLADERRAFYFLFSTEDQKEGMRAFSEKRQADWKGR